MRIPVAARVLPFAVFTLVGACSTPAVPRMPRADERSLTVVSYNVNYGLAGDPSMLAAIGAAPADVVLLQETTPAWEGIIRASSLADLYPHMQFHHDPGAGGLAVLSKGEIVELAILPEVTWFPAAVSVVETPVGRVKLLNVHLRPPFSDKGSVVSGYFTTPKLRVQEMASFANALDGELPTIVAGDFNEDDGGAVKLLQERGFVDEVPRFHPSAHTWRWTVSSVEVTGRLDHMLHDAKLYALDVRVVAAGNSDHLPIVAVLARH